MTTKEALCTTLAALVRERDMPNAELARRTGVPIRSLNEYMRGAVFPVRRIDAILREIGVSPARFLARAASEAMATDK